MNPKLSWNIAARGGASLVVCMLMTGCATSVKHKAHLQELHEQQVRPDVYAKAEHFKPLSLNDIEHMVSRGVAEETILYHVKKSRVVYQLTTSDVDRLREAGATEALIDYLLSTPSTHRVVYPLYYPPYPYGFYYDWGYPYGFPYRHYYYGPPYYRHDHLHLHRGLRHRRLR